MTAPREEVDRILVKGAAPIAKVQAAMIAGAVTTIVVWALGQFVGVDLPAAVSAALTVLLTAGAAYLKR